MDKHRGVGKELTTFINFDETAVKIDLLWLLLTFNTVLECKIARNSLLSLAIHYALLSPMRIQYDSYFK